MAKRAKIDAAIRQTNLRLDNFCLFLQTPDVDDLDLLRTKFELCEPLLKEQQSNLLELESLDNTTKALVDEWENAFEEKYSRAISRAKALLPRQTSTPVSQSQILNNSVAESKVRLPTISIPSFSGAYEEWSEFRDTFNALVHNNESISNVQKFHYLKSALRNDAARVIHSLEANDANYAVAWNLLRERYENLRLIVNGHIRAIFELQTLSKENLVGLRNLTDTLVKGLRCLKALNLPTEQWDALIIYIITAKLDATTKRDFESSLSARALPTTNQLISFLNNRCNLLESIQGKEASANKNIVDVYPKRRDKFHSYASTVTFKCFYCNGKHSIFRCEKFNNITLDERRNFVKTKNLCYNCLRSGHAVRDCKSGTCYKCNGYHHSLLHVDKNEHRTQAATIVGSEQAEAVPVKDDSSTKRSTGAYAACSTPNAKNDSQLILLATANVYIEDRDGRNRECRALLDNGSQSNFITEDLVELLQLKKNHASSVISGVGSKETRIKYTVNATIRSIYSNFTRTISCLVMDKITENIPPVSFDASLLNVPAGVELADRGFNKNQKIDILLGAEIFWDILQNKQVQLGRQMPRLQQTRLGYILAGCIYTSQAHKTHAFCALSDEIARFWVQEDVDKPVESFENKRCEKIFNETTTRDHVGRFVVSIPFRENLNQLGESRENAIKRFSALERRFARDVGLATHYKEFMREYETLGHMSKIVETNESDQNHYYLAHHAVIKNSSSSTKLRTVFDGSAKTSSGLSLNDVQYTGPSVQSELFAILIRFRKHRYVFSSDVEKMYRQIWVNAEQRNYQRILWRDSPDESLKCFVLNTVTYGLASSAYLATRCLKQLAIENMKQHPDACNAIMEDVYVDDLLSGAETIREAKTLIRDITAILSSAQLNLRKWIANERCIVDEVKSESDNLKILDMDSNASNKTLGVMWNPNKDSLQYNPRTFDEKEEFTKRTVLSAISTTFDPLALLGPVHITAKIFMQTLWKSKLQWDEPLQDRLRDEWQAYISDFEGINDIQIERHVLVREANYVELHGFCDASTRAFGACVYVKSKNPQGDCAVNLICAKTRVCPLRCVSLPRLELCGAALLAKLMKRVRQDLKIDVNRQVFWCDSTITLCWVNGEPCRWKTYVANRVAEIQSLTNVSEWRHVPTKENAADILTRGCNAKFLQRYRLWWHGPEWLLMEDEYWPNAESIYDFNKGIPETKINAHASVITTDFDLFEKFSDVNKLVRIMAYVLRYLNNLKHGNEKNVGSLTVDETQLALIALIKVAQRQAWDSEIHALRKGEAMKGSSNLLQFNPFLDDFEVMRVGGRLENSNLTYDAKHQILLPPRHKLTELIATNEHVRHMHCGPQLLLAVLRERYWIVAGRNLTRKIVHRCVKCFRAKPKSLEPLMGDLPAERLNMSFAFYNCGVDYGGPFYIKDKRTRGCKQIKCYICIFVCFSTKAVHLELASDLSADCFISVLRRFVARRGKPNCIFSDNATNFIGSKNELRHLVGLLQNQIDEGKLSKYFLTEEIKWKTIPPRTPNFGGLWEASVKSVKHHLRRVASSASLVFEEFYTILTQVEAILNSRPICPMSSNPKDLNSLTPSHFLIGRPMTAVIDKDLANFNPNRLVRYQRVQQIVQHFWKRWSLEYLCELQTRVKWKRPEPFKLEPDMLVIVREDNLPPCKWLLGRVLKVFPGADGAIRVATVKTSAGEIKRGVRRLCVLPIYSDCE